LNSSCSVSDTRRVTNSHSYIQCTREKFKKETICKEIKFQQIDNHLQPANLYFPMINVDLFEEELEDTKGVTRIRKSKKDRQTQWPKEKGQRDKQHSTKHIHKTKDRVTRIPLKTGDEIRCAGRVSSSCSTSGTRRVIECHLLQKSKKSLKTPIE
jgi:hypothetical protein